MVAGKEPVVVENTVSVPVEDYNDWAGKVSAQMTMVDRLVVPVVQGEAAEVMVEAGTVVVGMVVAAVTVLLPVVQL
jgi:hypothetical protein